GSPRVHDWARPSGAPLRRPLALCLRPEAVEGVLPASSPSQVRDAVCHTAMAQTQLDRVLQELVVRDLCKLPVWDWMNAFELVCKPREVPGDMFERVAQHQGAFGKINLGCFNQVL